MLSGRRLLYRPAHGMAQAVYATRDIMIWTLFRKEKLAVPASRLGASPAGVLPLTPATPSRAVAFPAPDHQYRRYAS
jgi:hypothetical protein